MSQPSYSFWKRNGLSLVLVALFLAFLLAQVLTGWAVDNEARMQDGQAPLALASYLRSGHFISATFENWESEFLQMGMYVLLTVWLRQLGSAESRPLDPAQEEEKIEPGPTPWPVHAGAAAREESRGGHYREDFPPRDEEKFMVHTMAYASQDGVRLDYKPVTFTRYKPMERKY